MFHLSYPCLSFRWYPNLHLYFAMFTYSPWYIFLFCGHFVAGFKAREHVWHTAYFDDKQSRAWKTIRHLGRSLQHLLWQLNVTGRGWLSAIQRGLEGHQVFSPSFGSLLLPGVS